MLQAAALHLGHSVGVSRQHQSAEHGQTGGAAGAGPDLCLAGLDEAHTGQLADLAVVDVLGGRILVDIDPLRVAAQVIGHIGVDDGHIALADGVGILGLQGSGRLVDEIGRQHTGGGQIGAAGHRGVARRRVDDVGAARQHLAGHGVQRAARLGCQHLGRLGDVVVDGGQLQHVGDGCPAAVLLHGGGQGGDGQGLSIGGHALGQRFGGLGQALVLAELDVLAVVGRDGVLVAELVMHQQRLRLVQQTLLVVGLHLGAHAGRAGVVCRLRKQLQIHVDFHLCAPFVSCFIERLPLSGSSLKNGERFSFGQQRLSVKK